VVGTELGGLPELIDPGVDGHIVPADDPAALAAALTGMTADPEAALRMGHAGRAKVARDFSPAAHLCGLRAAYADAGTR
jgi:glycosyltransferase involved in cell wall biosynthesis